MKAVDFRKGKVVKIDGKLVKITSFTHITPGNWRGMVQIKYKDILTGVGSQKRVRPEDKFEDVYLDNRKMAFLYKSGDAYVMMDNETFEQPELSAEIVGDAANFLRENDEVTVCFYEDKPISLELPALVVLEIKYTEPGARGDTVSNVTKPATLETDYEVKVPNHIKIGDKVRIDTRTGEFVERANE